MGNCIIKTKNMSSGGGYSVTNLGNIVINATDDYKANYSCTAVAYLINDYGSKYLKITGYWTNYGNQTSAQTAQFSTNINVGFTLSSAVSFWCFCYYQARTPSSTPYGIYNGTISTDGVVYLPIARENTWRSFNRFDYDNYLIPIIGNSGQ